MHDHDIHILIPMQLREGVRTEAEALALGQQIVACPGLFLRGLMTHHGNLDKFLPIISAFKETFGQVPGPCTPHLKLPCRKWPHRQGVCLNTSSIPSRLKFSQAPLTAGLEGTCGSMCAEQTAQDHQQCF